MMQRPTQHLAQFNIARIKYPLDDPRMAEFVDNLARVNGLAERSTASSGGYRTRAATPSNMRSMAIRAFCRI